MTRDEKIATIAVAAETTVEIITNSLIEQCQEHNMDIDELIDTHISFITRFPGMILEMKKLVKGESNESN